MCWDYDELAFTRYDNYAIKMSEISSVSGYITDARWQNNRSETTSKILHLHFITDATLMIYNDQEYLNKKHEVYRKT